MVELVVPAPRIGQDNEGQQAAEEPTVRFAEPWRPNAQFSAQGWDDDDEEDWDDWDDDDDDDDDEDDDEDWDDDDEEEDEGDEDWDDDEPEDA